MSSPPEPEPPPDSETLQFELPSEFTSQLSLSETSALTLPFDLALTLLKPPPLQFELESPKEQLPFNQNSPIKTYIMFLPKLTHIDLHMQINDMQIQMDLRCLHSQSLIRH